MLALQHRASLSKRARSPTFWELPMSHTPILRALSVAAGVDDAVSDCELLRRFAEANDRTAFELVVRRHAELVWYVCRTASRDLHTAEDAFQATFLALARKAASVRDSSAAGWLFRVARNATLRASTRAAQQNTSALPDTLVAPGMAAHEEVVRRELAPLVAEEVDRLSAKLREPVLLCFFEGHTHAEAATKLGWPVGTVASRLARAKQMLRTRLIRRGVVLPAGGLMAVFSDQCVTAAPASLIRTALATGLPAEHVPPAVLSLTEGVLSAMRFAQVKTFAACALVVLGLTIALAVASGNATADPAPTPPPTLTLAVIPVAELPPLFVAQAKAEDAKKLEEKDLKLLKGKWRVLKQVGAGEEDSLESLAKMQVTIEGSEMLLEHAGSKLTVQTKIHLAPGQTPKKIDLTALTGPEEVKGKTLLGIYELKDDKLTLCCPIEPIEDTKPAEKGRPKEFKTGDTTTLAVFERIKDEQQELESLAGEWKLVQVNTSGKEIAAEELKGAKWVIKGTEVTMAAEGETDEKASLKLDPSALPPAINVTIEGKEKGKTLVGIYFRQDDKLTICFRDPKDKNIERPTDLKPGEGHTFVVLERIPKK
jgi:RNA polymerase sigma factor (sigma-70 family)